MIDSKSVFFFSRLFIEFKEHSSFIKIIKIIFFDVITANSSVIEYIIVDKVFCKITYTYFVDVGSGYCDFDEGVNTYDVTFKKKENIAIIKRCGRDWDERSEDAIIEVEELIKLLVR